MSQMFYNAIEFDQPLTNFDTKSVTKMNRMFRDAQKFNQPLSHFDTFEK